MKNLDTFKNVVVLMLENRSFDNLLGYLYEDGVPAGKKYEGLQNKSISNPVPKRSIDYTEGKVIEVTKAEDYHQPYPDPGEEYQHVNSQIYNHVDPNNIGVDQHAMKPPYNIPQPQPTTPPMDGFVNDYINTLQALDGKEPTAEFYGKIMQCFTPEQTPVLSTLAKEFAVFDHWYCSVPSQTWCNRAFWHAATSGGEVINAVGEGGSTIDSLKSMLAWKEKVWEQPTLFDRLKEKNKSYTIYADLFPLTCVVNGINYLENTKLNFTDFIDDAKKGDLPAYSFIEPKFFGQHNDQHPSAEDKPTRDGTVLLGEKLIWEVYNAVKNSPQKDETLLIITHDEHGGCFDHVAPPSAEAPTNGMKGDLEFSFDRLGVRVPMVMVSSFIEKNTIINDVHDHTSFIKTMSDKWGLEGLTNRDKNANSFASVFSDQKRASYPEIPMPIIKESNDEEYKDDQLNGLQKSILKAIHMITKQNIKGDVLADVHKIEKVGDAIEHIKTLKSML